MDSGIHPTLHAKWHHQIFYSKHQIFYSKLNLKDEYSPAYICEIWHYNRAETDLFNCAIESKLHFYTSKLHSF